MDDLTSKVQEILGSEEGMQQIRDMARMLGLNPDGDPPTAPEQSPSSPSGPPGQGSLGRSPSGQISGGADLSGVLSLVQAAGQDSESIAFLKALRPLLKAERQKKVDEALKILKLLNLLPVLQKSGALQNLLGNL